jgi:Domain of unknown function (DUF6484)
MRHTVAPVAKATTAVPTHQMASTLLQSIAEHTPTASAVRPVKVDGVAIGTVYAIGQDGRVQVNMPALGLTAVWATSVVTLQTLRLDDRVALAFEAGDPMRPMVLGRLVGAADGAFANETPSLSPFGVAQAIVDGQRVILTAEREIELRCGEAAIILSADGHIQLRGTYITSQASATQRILGGSVNVN